MVHFRYFRNFKLKVGSEICKFVSLYWSSSQTSDGFEKLIVNFRLTLDTLAESNSHLIMVLRYFKIKSKNWYINDKATTEGTKIEFVTSQYGLYQMINEPTHILENYSSYIDLIFTSQPNLVVDSGVHPSSVIHSVCKIKLENFPSPYQREICH